MFSRSVSRIALSCAAVALAASLPGLTSALQAQTAPTAVLNDYANASTGDGNLQYGVMQAPDGNFYLTTGSGSIILRVTPATSTTGTVSTLAGQLPSSCGVDLYTNLIEASDGNLYSMSTSGAADGYGAFFKYAPSTKTCTELYNFNNSTDNSQPTTVGGLTYGSDGNFYGVMRGGGDYGQGVVFQMTPAGVYREIYSFCSAGTSAGCPDGAAPTGYLIEASDGNWYGVTSAGGSGANVGTLYELTPGVTYPWVQTVIYNMAAATGYHEIGPIVEGPDGAIYGSLESGGAVDGDGSIFQYQIAAQNFDDYYDNNINYQEPQALILGGDGNLYGTSFGYQCNCPGDFYQLTPGNTATWTNLATFTSTSPAVYGPYGQIVQGSDGNFYGAGPNGGSKSAGGLYQAVVTPSVPAPIAVTLSSSTYSGAAPIKVSYTVNNATSMTAQNCYLYTQSGGGTFTGKASGTQSGATLSGSVSVTPTETGTFTYAVECAGSYAGISPVLTVTGLAAAATQTVLTASPNPVSIGSSVTLTATVTRTSATGIPGGSVAFEDQGLVLATVPLNPSGIAKLTASTSPYPAATYPVTAHYVPDSTDMASVSNTVKVVLKYGTTTTLSVSPSTVTIGSDVTITVHVGQNTGSGTPTGTVTIYADGGAEIKNYPLTNGTATIVAPTTGFPAGTYSVTAGYNGNTTENVSTSAVQKVTLQN